MPTSIRSRPRACSCRPTRRSRMPEDLAGVPISVGYQSGSHYSTIQALEPYLRRRPDQPVVRRRHAVQADGAADRRQGAGLVAVQRALLLRRAARLPQDHRHHLHDRDHDHRRSRSGGSAQVLPRAAPRATRHRPAARSLYALLQERVPAALSRRHGHAPLGSGRAAGVRALHPGGLRGDLPLDRRPRHLRRRRHGRGPLRGRRDQHAHDRPERSTIRARRGAPWAPATARPQGPTPTTAARPIFPPQAKCYPSARSSPMGRHAQILHSSASPPSCSPPGSRRPRARSRAAAPVRASSGRSRTGSGCFAAKPISSAMSPPTAATACWRPRTASRARATAAAGPATRSSGCASTAPASSWTPATATARSEDYLAPRDHRIGRRARRRRSAQHRLRLELRRRQRHPARDHGALRGRGEAARSLWPRLARQRRHPAAGRHRAARGDRDPGARRADRRAWAIRSRPAKAIRTGRCGCRTRASASSAFSAPCAANITGPAATASPATSPAAPASATNPPASAWARQSARWESGPCHRSLYGYQMRSALGARGRERRISRSPSCRSAAPAPGSTPASSAASASANARAPAPMRPARAARRRSSTSSRS